MLRNHVRLNLRTRVINQVPFTARALEYDHRPSFHLFPTKVHEPGDKAPLPPMSIEVGESFSRNLKRISAAPLYSRNP